MACGSTFSRAGLADGPHTLTVAATDAFGQVGTATRSFRVDTKDPLVKIKKGPKGKTTKRKARFKFKATEQGAKTKCKLDREKYEKCKSPVVFRVKPGRHKLLIQATDPRRQQGPPGDLPLEGQAVAGARPAPGAQASGRSG